MELENSQNNALAKLPMLKLGEYEMWEIRIKQYFQIQDYALWEVIENGNSWVPIPVTAPESGPSTALKMTVPSTAEEKICKKNDVKARSLLLMALPNEHQLTFNQYVDAQSMFAAIKARFGGNEATKRTQKALLKQQYENFNASSSESLDSIFNRLQKLVSRLAILGVVTPPEDLNVKFLRSLPSEWDTHVVVWMNKPDFDTMGLDDLYNNFKIVEQKVKKSAGASNDDKNLAFVTTSGASSTNNIDTVNPKVSTAITKINTASTEICIASFSDATIYAFLSTQPKGSQLVHEDLEQLHDDDLEEIDLKWNMALLSMRARKFYQRTGRKIIIDGSNTAGYDKSKAVKIEDASEKAMCAIDGAGFDWSDMAEEEIQANMALMAFSDSEVTNDKSCSKNCLKNYKALKKQYDDLLVKLSDTDFKAATYKRGLATLEGQIIKYREHEVRFSEEIALLKISVGSKEYQMGLLRAELEKVKQEKEGFEFKIAKFDKSAKDLSEMLESQITDKSKKGVGYHVVPSPHPLILNRPTPLDLSYSGLEEFKEPEVNEYGPKYRLVKAYQLIVIRVDKDWKEKFFYLANHVREVEPKKVRENNDAPIIEDWVSDDEDDDEPNPKVEKKTVIPTATKKEFVKPEKPVKRSVRYAEMYMSQRPRGNQRNWNGQKSNQLGCNFVFNNKACFICGSFDHIQYSCPNQQRKRIVSRNNYNKKDNDYYSKTSHPSAHKHMAPRAVLMKTGLKSVNTARPVNTVRSVNTGRPFSTARFQRQVKELCYFVGAYEQNYWQREKGIKREYSIARTPQQNGVAERKNRTLIEAARTMLADSKLPTTFWAEAVSTACYEHILDFCKNNAETLTVQLQKDLGFLWNYLKVIEHNWYKVDTMVDVNVNAPAEQAPAMAPPTRTDDQILPRSSWVPVGKSNCYLDVEKSQSNPIYKIAMDIPNHTNFFRAFTASSTIPSIYIQQFWDTIRYVKNTGYLKFSAKGTKQGVFGMPIPNDLITDDIRGEQYYNMYREKVAKHQRYLVGEEGSDPDSPAPKPSAAKASKSTSSQQPKPKPAPAKPQEKKQKLTTETSDTPSPAIKLVRAVEESLKDVHAVYQGLLPPVVIREPESGKFQPLLEVQGKGREKVGEEQDAQVLLNLQTPKKKSPANQFIFQRRTPVPTEPSGHEESYSLYAELGLTNSEAKSDDDVSLEINPEAQDEGQARPNPGKQVEGQAGSNPGDDAESQP
ncbi:putative ribonuclease H-like domain-containing protein [Tanacetum coccineum]